MLKSTFTPAYQLLRQQLVALRTAAGLSQRDLARKLGREHSFVARYELGDRRLDPVELLWILRACGVDPVKTTAELMKAMDSMEPSKRSRR